MLSPELTLKKAQRPNENDRWNRLFIIVIFLLMSVGCIFCSSQSALWFIDRSHIEARTLTSKYADYSLGPLIPVSHVDATRIAFERAQDDKDLENLSEPFQAAGLVAEIPQMGPTPTFFPSVTPTPTITPTARPAATATPAVPSPTPAPSPTVASPTPITTLSPTAPPAATLPPPSTATPAATLPPPSTATPAPTLPLPPDDDDDDDDDPPPPTPPDTPTPVPPDTPTPTPTPIPPVVQFSALTYRVAESAGQAILTVALDKASGQTVTINYATIDSSPATIGQDYERVNNILTFAPGQTQKTFSVPILNDNFYELAENVALSLSNPTNATLGSINAVTLEILDDDPRPTLSFEKSNYPTPEQDGPTVITATLDNLSSLAITTVYTLTDETAVAGDDYRPPQTGTLTFGPGQTVATFAVTIIGDALNELDETVLLSLGPPANASLGSATATLTIEDDDISIVQFDRSIYAALESDLQATITATLSPPASMPLTVDYTTSDLTATAGQDYTAVNNTLVFNPGQTSATFSVTITDETLKEPVESALLTLSNPAPSSLIIPGSPLTATLTITDGSDTGGCGDPLSPIPAGEPNIGPANGVFMEVYCNSAFIFDLGPDIIDTTTPDTNFDFVYYEEAKPNPPTSITHIRLDWVIVEVAPAINGPWYQVFYWGDTITDINTNIGQAGYGPASSNPTTIETDNEFIGIADLYGSLPYKIGIAIDIDAEAPPDIYRYLRFSVPNGGGDDVMEIDAIEILP